MTQAEDGAPIPRWVKVSGLIVAIVVLLVLVVLLLGGGLSGHGPSRHSGGQDGDTSRIAALESVADKAGWGATSDEHASASSHSPRVM